jgi:hypothetical protein
MHIPPIMWYVVAVGALINMAFASERTWLPQAQDDVCNWHQADIAREASNVGF